MTKGQWTAKVTSIVDRATHYTFEWAGVSRSDMDAWWLQRRDATEVAAEILGWSRAEVEDATK